MTELEQRLKTLTSSSAATARTLLRRRVRLEVIAGPDAGAHHDFDRSARVGTRELADLVLHDPKVSGLHFEIDGEDLRVRDLGSKNGTFFGAARIVEALIPAGESIVLGDTSIRVAPLGETVEIDLSPATDFYGVIGCAASLRAVTANLARLAGSESTVLLYGETGTGKERAAEALHLAGPRRSNPLVVVDCGALPANLIESELFGHERGAFTGAVSSVPGAFERAHGGTLFLDEIGELPLDLQPKLLRVLEARKVCRLGGVKQTAVNIRIIAATNRDLALEIVRGRFREDLYYRLAVVTVTVPPLRERLEDLPLLAAHLLRDMGVDPETHLTAQSLATLARYDWPGNIRELRNTLERAVALSRPLEIEPVAPIAGVGANGRLRIDLRVPLRTGKQQLQQEYERAYVTALLTECRGNISEAARRAGVDRMSIHRMIQRLGLRGESAR